MIGGRSPLSDMADRISLGEVGVARLPIRGHDEIARLAGSFNRMRRSLAAAMQMLSDSDTHSGSGLRRSRGSLLQKDFRKARRAPSSGYRRQARPSTLPWSAPDAKPVRPPATPSAPVPPARSAPRSVCVRPTVSTVLLPTRSAGRRSGAPRFEPAGGRRRPRSSAGRAQKISSVTSPVTCSANSWHSAWKPEWRNDARRSASRRWDRCSASAAPPASLNPRGRRAVARPAAGSSPAPPARRSSSGIARRAISPDID